HQSENQADLVALGVEERAYAQRRNHQSQCLREGDGAVLRWRKPEALGKIARIAAKISTDTPSWERSQEYGIGAGLPQRLQIRLPRQQTSNLFVTFAEQTGSFHVFLCESFPKPFPFSIATKKDGANRWAT